MKNRKVVRVLVGIILCCIIIIFIKNALIQIYLRTSGNEISCEEVLRNNE